MLTDMAAIDSSAAANTFRGRTRQRQWEQLSRGLYVPRASPLSEVLRGWELVLPKSAAFTSLTAAELEGWWLPEAETVHGLRITTAAETLLAAARDLGVLDLVILGDSALRCGDCTLEELHATAAQQRRGGPRLRAVLPLLDKRSESPWESVMRVLHQAAGIDVEPQKEIFDQWGRFVARADLWLVGTRRIHGYDGDQHRERQIHRSDLARDRRLVEIDWQRAL